MTAPIDNIWNDQLTIKQIVFTLYCTFVLVGLHYGTGRHVGDISSQDYQTAMMVRFTTSMHIFCIF